MSKKLQISGWITVGLVSGILVSLGVSAVAQKDSRLTLPIDELRQLPKPSAAC